MYADFSEEAYDAYKNGEAVLNNNGFRSVKGNYMSDQPEYSEIEDRDESQENTDGGSDVLTMAIVAAVSIVGTIVVTKAVPHIENWWVYKAYPGIKRTWRKITKKEAKTTVVVQNNIDDAIELVPQNQKTLTDFSKEIDSAFNEFKQNMSSSEAQKHILAIMGAAAFIADEIRKLSDSCICDDSEFIELKSAMEKLTTQQVSDSINRMLESKSYVLDEKTASIFMKFFGGGNHVYGTYIPIENEKVKVALSLTYSGCKYMESV